MSVGRHIVCVCVCVCVCERERARERERERERESSSVRECWLPCPEGSQWGERETPVQAIQVPLPSLLRLTLTASHGTANILVCVCVCVRKCHGGIHLQG